MNDYRRGILVKVIQSGRSRSGKVYGDHVLMEAAGLADRRPIPCHLGHAQQGYVGRFVGLEYAHGALWGCLAGADSRALVRMHEGARAEGRGVLGVSIAGRSLNTPGDNVVERIELLRSIDLDTRSEHALAGGMVPFTEEGLPIPWEDRQAYWSALGRRRLAALESRITRLVAEAARPTPRGPVVMIHESACGRLLRPIA